MARRRFVDASQDEMIQMTDDGHVRLL
ncbi:MAG: hypothetical protein QOD67_334, partial [Caballeronia sp.]|nr:hypothetical protein [Caballeronia sp.]